MATIKKFKPFEAPFRYVFVDPDTKYKYSATTKEALIERIFQYRNQNKLSPLKSIDLILENYWCGLPENVGKCQNLTLSRSWVQYLKGGIPIIENLFYGEKNMVAQDVAEARAKICKQCTKNVFPDKSGFMQWADDIAVASVGEREVREKEKLGLCEVCTCVLNSKVFYGGEIKLSDKEKAEMKEAETKDGVKLKCWQVTE